MDLKQLEYFVAVAEELHFGRAAERLHLAQQPLSFKIKQLEDELGVQLFNRTTRRVELTPSGEIFLQEVYLALQHLKRGVERAQQAHYGLRGKLLLGYNSLTLYNVLPSILQQMKQNYPDIEVILKEMHSPYLEQNILEDGLDAGLLAIESTLEQLAWMPLLKEPICVVLPKNHAFAHCEQIALNALADEAWIFYDRVQKPLSHAQFNELCRHLGFRPCIVQEAISSEAMIGLVSAGIGISLTAHSMRHYRADTVVYRPLIEPSITVEYGLAWKTDRQSPMLNALINTAQSFVPTATAVMALE